MLSKIKNYIVVSVISSAVGIAGTLAVIHLVQPQSDNKAQVTSQTISGAPLTVKSITSKDKTTTIDAIYSGAGESKLDVPDSQIPAANAWDNYKWGIGGMVSTNLTYSLIGSYRYDRVMALGSIWYKNANGYEFGLSAGAMYLF